MNSLRDQARAWRTAGRPAIVVTIADASGSVPREAGTRLLVAADAVAGTIGGGRLEFEAIALARAALPGARPFEHRFALGPSLGQCCGGAVTLAFSPLDDAAMQQWDPEAPLFHLQLHGAGHVGREIARLLERLPVVVDWIDERDDEFALYRRERGTPGLPAAADLRMLAVDAPAAEVAGAPPGTRFLVMTHSHDLDFSICEAVLRRGDAGFLGLIGSQTKRARFLSRLRRRGLDERRLATLTCPIGAPGIRSKRPELIAVAVVAQLLALPGKNDPDPAPRRPIQAESGVHNTPEETT